MLSHRANISKRLAAIHENTPQCATILIKNIYICSKLFHRSVLLIGFFFTP